MTLRPVPRTLQVYQSMVARGVRPSIATFGTLITAASDTGDVAAVKQVPVRVRHVARRPIIRLGFNKSSLELQISGRSGPGSRRAGWRLTQRA